MLREILTEELVVFGAELETPEEAIELAGNILVEAGKVEKEYVKAMIDTYHALGSYIVLAPGIAMPHSRPDITVKEPCMSFVQLKSPINFNHPDNDPVQLVFALGGVDASSHIDMLKALSALLSNHQNIEKLKNVKNYDGFLKIISEVVYL